MRHVKADWRAIEAALETHQLRTLRDYARTKGLDADTAWDDSSYRVVAIALAVENAIAASMVTEGFSEHQALARIAVRFDLDIETLLRQRRRFRRQT
jgi:hypothetical protein